MAVSPWRLPLDRAVRYAVSDALASVKSHMYDLEYTQRRSPQELETWNNYLADLRTLHQRLLALPNLETAQWLTDDHAMHAPTFTPFVSSIGDAKTNIRRVYNWLHSLPQSTTRTAQANAALADQQHYTHQVDQALSQLQLLPAPGSDAWFRQYQPPAPVSAQQPLARVAA